MTCSCLRLRYGELLFFFFPLWRSLALRVRLRRVLRRSFVVSRRLSALFRYGRGHLVHWRLRLLAGWGHLAYWRLRLLAGWGHLAYWRLRLLAGWGHLAYWRLRLLAGWGHLA
jgi:hypothetical protein